MICFLFNKKWASSLLPQFFNILHFLSNSFLLTFLHFSFTMEVLVWNWVRYSDEIWKRIVKLQRNMFYFSQMNILAINVTWNKLVNKTRTFCKNLQCKVHLKSNCVAKYLIIYIKPEIVSYISHFLPVLVFWGTLSSSPNKFVLPNWQQYFYFIS